MSSQRVVIPASIRRYSTPRFTSKTLSQLLVEAGTFFWKCSSMQKIHKESTDEALKTLWDSFFFTFS